MTEQETMTTEPEVTQEAVEQQAEQQESQPADSEQSETDTAAEEARKEAARKGFEERKAKRAREEQLKAENEYLKSIVSRVATQPQQQQQAQPQQVYNDPNEPKLEIYFANGRSAEEWSRDHRVYLESEMQKQQHVMTAQKTIASKIEEYSKVNKDIFEYERELAAMVTPAVAAAIVASDKIGELIEKLVLDDESIARLNAIQDPYRLSREIIKIEETLTKKRNISGAPNPPSTTKSKAPQGSGSDISTMSKAEYRAFRNNQRKR